MNNSHLPIRRRGLGDNWQTQVIGLDAAQTARFLSRHPDIRPRIQLFEQEVRNYGYQQGVTTNYAIPEYGIGVPDAEFANVIIFPDANGRLIYTGNVPDNIAGVTNKPPYQSPLGDDPNPLLPLLNAIPWIIGGLLGLSLLQTFRGSK